MPLLSEDQYIAGYIIKNVLTNIFHDEDEVVMLPIKYESYVRNIPDNYDRSKPLLIRYWFNAIDCLVPHDNVFHLLTQSHFDAQMLAAESLSQFYPNGFRFVPDKIYHQFINPVEKYDPQLSMEF